MSDKKVILIEDDVLITKAYCDGLEREGYQVRAVTDGLLAGKAIAEFMPDLILLDLYLPGKSGFEILDEISIDKMLKKIPVIMLTVSGKESDWQKSKKYAVADYLVKSDISMEGLLERVNQILETTGR